jgi:phenol 2-monooxygenase
MRCAIHSANSGALMVIPRENGLVRLYIQLLELKPDSTGRADRSQITPAVIISAAQKTLSPYKITYNYCDWWTAYQIGQRVGTTFSKFDRVFLAGDAVHTHSPKAGQGMNVSMQDTYNLSWKIGLAARKLSPRSILATYESERRGVAKALIEFDHKFSRLFSGRPARDVIDEEGVSMEEFKRVFEKGNFFASGLSVEYEDSVIVDAKGTKQQLAKNVKVGMRFPSFKVLNQADARPWHFQEWMKSDGRFRIVLFAGNMKDGKQRDRVNRFCQALEKESSFLRRVTGTGKPIDSVVEILTVHSAPRREVEFFDFPDLLHPFDADKGWDYNKIFVDDESYHEGHGEAYKGYGVDPERGCVVVLRPDQYVAYVGEIENVESLEGYFARVLLDGNGHRCREVKRKEVV